MVNLRVAFPRYLKGFRRTAVFAVTTCCNCRCVMCDMHKKRQESIGLEDAKRTLDFLNKNRFLIVYFTGGEPTLHPNIADLVGYANQLGLMTTVTTNGTATKSVLKALRNSGLYLLSVSLDHWDPAICDEIRGYRGIKARQEETIRYASHIGIRTYALTVLNPFIIGEDAKRIVRYVNQVLGVPFGFCYPTISDVNTYCIGTVFTQEAIFEKLRRSVEVILSMKRNGFKIANTGTYIEDILKIHEGKTPNFYCKGGEAVVYIDWFGDVYPCFLKGKLFNALDDETPRFIKDARCNDCLINCFREPSLIPTLFSPKLLIKEALYARATRKLYL
ncbi:MAG: radical SAM protein [Nitrososphaeria archaeon]|nr:radical SAM protein [Nitrososphaeria archaeon]NIN53352.1 radical SAM protein [Nitrososphaeria archaeon]NIQ33818.1 radical SAM protein [Nitrososphaeria archaeon]